MLTSWYNLYQHHNDTADLRSCDCIEPNEDRYNKGMELLIHERESTPSTIPTTILQCPIDDTDSSVPDMFTVSSKDSDEDYSNNTYEYHPQQLSGDALRTSQGNSVCPIGLWDKTEYSEPI